jgi:hypothetical protein
MISLCNAKSIQTIKKGLDKSMIIFPLYIEILLITVFGRTPNTPPSTRLATKYYYIISQPRTAKFSEKKITLASSTRWLRCLA